MSFSESRIIKQIAILPESNSVNVQWANQILRDGEVITETFERKAYVQAQAAEFAVEVEGAAGYMAVLGW